VDVSEVAVLCKRGLLDDMGMMYLYGRLEICSDMVGASGV
jgi:hypothetical protein